MTITTTIAAIIAEATSNAAGATTRGAVDVSGSDGGRVHLRIANGGTGPTAQAVASVMISDVTGSLPATGAAGATWKVAATAITPGTAASAVRDYVWEFGPGHTHIQVEVTGNTGQAVTCEATVMSYVYS